MLQMSGFLSREVDIPRPTIDAEESALAVQDEMEALASIFGEDVETLGESVLRVRCRALKSEEALKSLEATKPRFQTKADAGLEKPAIWLTIAFPVGYPCSMPIFELQSMGLLSYAEEDDLYSSLLEIAGRSCGAACGYELCLHAIEVVDVKLRKRAVESYVWTHRKKPEGTSEGEDGISPKASLTATEKWDAYREALYASDAELLRPSNYVYSIASILLRLPPIGVLKIENVINPRNAVRFLKQQTLFEQKYGPGVESESTTLFHGTRAHNVSSIVTAGLVVPGSHGVEVANGSAYGVGIYLSSSAEYSVGFSAGEGRLLVCAALPGRCTSGTSKRHSDCIHPNDIFYVFGNPAQVLPVYCIHFDHSLHHGKLYTAATASGSVVRVMGEALSHGSTTLALTKQEPQLSEKNNAAFYLGAGYEVLEKAPYDDDDETSLMYGEDVKEFLSNDYEGDDDGSYQQSRFDGPQCAPEVKDRKLDARRRRK